MGACNVTPRQKINLYFGMIALIPTIYMCLKESAAFESLWDDAYFANRAGALTVPYTFEDDYVRKQWDFVRGYGSDEEDAAVVYLKKEQRRGPVTIHKKYDTLELRFWPN